MTAPVAATVDLPGEARLSAIAAWDVSRVHGAVLRLRDVAQRLAVWRARLGEVARALETEECWSGPAARNAASAAYDLSAVATAVDAALQDSLDSFERLDREVGPAQERAAEVMATARGHDGIPLEFMAESRFAATMAALLPGLPAPALSVAEDALHHAAAAAAAADAAGEALAGLGVRDAFGPATFEDLAGRLHLVGPVAPPEVRGDASPQEVAAWWAGLSAGAQLAALRAAPGVIGALDGVPAWARDRANRLLLDRPRRHGGTPTTRAVADRIAIEEAAGRPVQVHLLDLDTDEVVLVLGDLDTADAVGVVVPGAHSSPGDDLHRLAADARRVTTAARGASPGLAVATVVWLGYASPHALGDMATRFAAWRGGPKLAAALEGIAATRAASGLPRQRTSVLAHSYGTAVVDEAADVPGRLAADAVVLLGSPGMEESAGSLEVPEVYDAAAPSDVISWGNLLGEGTRSRRYGSTDLPVETWMGHSGYYDPDHPTLAAIGDVVAGTRTPD